MAARQTRPDAEAGESATGHTVKGTQRVDDGFAPAVERRRPEAGSGGGEEENPPARKEDER